MSNAICEYRGNAYSFAYDLVAEVVAVRGEIWSQYITLPTPQVILFTQQHKDWIKNFLVSEQMGEKLDDLLHDVRSYYDDDSLRLLMEASKKDYYASSTPTEFNDGKEFICACAKIAYIGAYHYHANSNACHLAVETLYDWILSLPASRFYLLLALDKTHSQTGR